MKYFGSLFLFIIGTVCFAQTPRYTLSGIVRDSSSFETLVGALVYIQEQKGGDVTDANGRFTLSLPKGKYSLKISYTGYTAKEMTVNLDGNEQLNIALASAVVQAKEVIVSTERQDANVSSTNMGRQVINMETAKALPALLGEVDIMKVLQMLPGVQAAGEGNSGFYVRGGGPDQNLVLLDDATIYNTGHLFGFFSVFNSDIVKSVTLEKGSMPANYGGRISSVIDVKSKEPDMKRWRVEGGLGLIASRLTIQGPIKKDRASIFLSGRRTYLELITKPIFSRMQGGKFAGNSYYFYDLNGKININLSPKDRLSLSGYFGRDAFNFQDPDGDFKVNLPWGNASGVLRWSRSFNPKLYMSVSAIYNEYRFKANTNFSTVNLSVNSSIQEAGGKIAFEYSPFIGHSMKFGAEGNYHIFTPYTIQGETGATEFSNSNADKKHAQQTAIYFLDDFDVLPWFRLNVGLRASLFSLVGPYKKTEYNTNGTIKEVIQHKAGENVKTYWGLEPRIGARFKLAEATSLKTGFHLTRQYIHMVPTANSSLPVDLWVPSTRKVKPQTGLQYSLGVFQNFLNDMVETSVELYYKDLYNQIEIGQSSVRGVDFDVEDSYTFGRGRAYGSEFFVKKAKGRWTGWVGYTLAWSNRQFPGIDNGKRFPSKYDRRHDLNVVLMWDISKRWKVSAAFVYASGNTTTLPSSIYFINGEVHYKWADRNSWRLPPYHRLDLGVTYVMLKAKFYSDISFSIYNVYNRQNPYFVYVHIKGDPASGDQQALLRQSSLFPILPSITWNFKW